MQRLRVWLSLMMFGLNLFGDGVCVASDRAPIEELPSPPGVAFQAVLEDDAALWLTPQVAAIDVPKIGPSETGFGPLDCDAWFRGYRVGTHATSWVVGDGDQFGMVSLGSDHYLKPGVNSGFGTGFDFHLLSGPERTDLPPRMYDFSIAYQCRDWINGFGYDVAASVMVSSDLEGSAREGIRYPSHAVGFVLLTDTAVLVLGADYLDRRDIQLLPVCGLILQPNPRLRFELVFPRPRVDIRLSDERSLFFAGELGGGTWAVERDSWTNDLVTYRDLHIGVGLESRNDEGQRSAIEVAFLFDRQLEFTSGFGTYRPNSTVMIRSVSDF